MFSLKKPAQPQIEENQKIYIQEILTNKLLNRPKNSTEFTLCDLYNNKIKWLLGNNELSDADKEKFLLSIEQNPITPQMLIPQLKKDLEKEGFIIKIKPTKFYDCLVIEWNYDEN